MTTTQERLSAPFDPDVVSWRVGSTTKDKTKGMALAYIDARDVMERLDEVVGTENWQCHYTAMPNGTTCCNIGLFSAAGEWVWKANGAGATDVEGEKGAYSDAFKRAAVLWGVGRYLYGLKSPWVELEARGNTYIIKDSEYAKLRAVLTSATANTTAHGLELQLRFAASSGGVALGEAWQNMQPILRDLPQSERQKVVAAKDQLKAALSEDAA